MTINFVKKREHKHFKKKEKRRKEGSRTHSYTMFYSRLCDNADTANTTLPTQAQVILRLSFNVIPFYLITLTCA